MRLVAFLIVHYEAIEDRFILDHGHAGAVGDDPRQLAAILLSLQIEPAGRPTE